MRKASLLFIFEPNPGLESSMSTLRSGPRSPRSPDLVRRLALFLFVAEALIFQGFRYFYVVADLPPPTPSRFIADENKKCSCFSTRTQGKNLNIKFGSAPLCSDTTPSCSRPLHLRSACLRSRTPASVRIVDDMLLLPLINDEWESHW